MKKRVYCLYRVSTKGQVDKDDIPMQKQVCREFAEKKDWIILREFAEKGVSGFKVSAKDRDAIQEIQRDAAAGKFDVLLVFMFDRLGRKDDETPFVVQWFTQKGIEVWSTVEGQQRFDNHVDKLLNYIRYWQASGESEKTSIRVKTRMAQLVQEGKFRGGVPSYGFRLVKKGRIGKKNRELYDIEINPDEAIAIREMFDLADHFGYGGRRISSELLEKGIVNLRTGEPFHYSTIQHLLRNIQNAGVLRSGESRSDVIPELAIVTMDQFDRVQKGLTQRSSEYLARRKDAELKRSWLEDGSSDALLELESRVPARIIGRALLSGNVYCGHCGGRMFASTARRSHHPVQTENARVPIYKCYNRTQHKELCDGPTTYRAEKVDRVVESLVQGIFLKAQQFDASSFVREQVRRAAVEVRQQLLQAQRERMKCSRDLEKWEGLMLASVDGTCVFTPEQVKKQIEKHQAAVDELTERIRTLETKATNARQTAEQIVAQHQQLLSWGELFADASLDEKKMIVANLVKAVTISRDYGITIDFAIDEAQFLNGMSL